MSRDTTYSLSIDSPPPTRWTTLVTKLNDRGRNMSPDAQKNRHYVNAYNRRRKAEGYRHVRALLPPDLLEVLDVMADGRSRAAAIADLLAEKAAELHLAEEGGV